MIPAAPDLYPDDPFGSLAAFASWAQGLVPTIQAGLQSVANGGSAGDAQTAVGSIQQVATNIPTLLQTVQQLYGSSYSDSLNGPFADMMSRLGAVAAPLNSFASSPDTTVAQSALSQIGVDLQQLVSMAASSASTIAAQQAGAAQAQAEAQQAAQQAAQNAAQGPQTPGKSLPPTPPSVLPPTPAGTTPTPPASKLPAASSPPAFSGTTIAYIALGAVLVGGALAYMERRRK